MKTDQITCDTVTAAHTISENLKARSAEIEDIRRLPSDLVQEMAQTGFFKMLTAQDYGGGELSPRKFVETLEVLACANASASWCAMIGSTSALNSAYLSPDDAQTIYGDASVISGGVFAPLGKAIDKGDHYLLSGRWQWGSGSTHCDWLCGGACIFKNDELQTLSNGAPDTRMMIFPAHEAQLIDTWHVAGLKGTGSGDFEVCDIKIPKSYSVSLTEDIPHVKRALYSYPALSLLALGVASVSMGNARGALDAFRNMAIQKRSNVTSRPLSVRSVIQADYAKVVASWRSARAYLFKEIDSTWEIALNGQKLTLDHRARLRMACIQMTRIAADVTRSCYDMGGGAALFLNNELQQRFRDSHAMTQHITVSPVNWEVNGRFLFELPISETKI